MTRRLATAMYLMSGVAAVFLPFPSIAGSALLKAAAEPIPVVTDTREVERRTVEMTTDTALALTTDSPFTELSIANPAIADISTISNNSVYLLGKKPGRTTLMLMGEGGQVMSIIDVHVSADISELQARLAEILPGEKIEAFTANDGIVLTGRISDQAQMDRAMAIASHYAPGRISNFMTIAAAEPADPDLSAIEAELRAVLPSEGIAVAIMNGGLVISGEASSVVTRDVALALAERHAPGRVTPLLKVSAPVEVIPDAEEAARHLAEILPFEEIQVHALGEALVLSGSASSAEAAQRAVEVARLAGGGVPISNLIVVRTAMDCIVKTRRGGETVETTIPCRQQAASRTTPVAVTAEVETATALGIGVPEAGLLRPRPRPLRAAVN